jgi:rubrerythrin
VSKSLAVNEQREDRERLAPLESLGIDRKCPGCGYGIASERTPDRCPMCGGRTWKLVGRPAPVASRS